MLLAYQITSLYTVYHISQWNQKTKTICFWQRTDHGLWIMVFLIFVLTLRCFFQLLCSLNLLEVCLPIMGVYSKRHFITAMAYVLNNFCTDMCMRKKGCTGTRILGYLCKYVLNQIRIMYKILSYILFLFRWVLGIKYQLKVCFVSASLCIYLVYFCVS